MMKKCESFGTRLDYTLAEIWGWEEESTSPNSEFSPLRRPKSGSRYRAWKLGSYKLSITRPTAENSRLPNPKRLRERTQLKNSHLLSPRVRSWPASIQCSRCHWLSSNYKNEPHWDIIVCQHVKRRYWARIEPNHKVRGRKIACRGKLEYLNTKSWSIDLQKSSRCSQVQWIHPKGHQKHHGEECGWKKTQGKHELDIW